MVPKIIVCSEFADIPDKTGRKQQEEEHRQLQGIMRFTQTQELGLFVHPRL